MADTARTSIRPVIIITAIVVPVVVVICLAIAKYRTLQATFPQAAPPPQAAPVKATDLPPTAVFKEPVPAAAPAAAPTPAVAGDRRQDILDRRVLVRHILVAYTGAFEADPAVKLGREEAFNVAREIKARLDAAPDEFAPLVRKYSDDRATAANDGLIPPFNLRDVAPAFREAIEKLKPGETSGVVETPFGFHLIRLETVEEAILQSILIQYAGALQAGPEVTRTAAEAEALARDLHARIIGGLATFDGLAQQYSEDPWAARGGYMNGVVTRGAIPHPEIETAAFALQEGAVSEVIRSPLGFQILKRHPVEYRQACQIVILYGPDTRVQEAARRFADEAWRELKEGMPFPDAVKKYSDGPVAETHGFTPVIYRGTWVPRLEEQLFNMAIGSVSEPIELSTGYVIMARVR
jgi:parvulin-like peptidyl-prolyl isomerase